MEVEAALGKTLLKILSSDAAPKDYNSFATFSWVDPGFRTVVLDPVGKAAIQWVCFFNVHVWAARATMWAGGLQ